MDIGTALHRPSRPRPRRGTESAEPLGMKGVASPSPRERPGVRGIFPATHNAMFLDGNKRGGAAAAIVFLAMNDMEVKADEDGLVTLTLRAARGEAGKAGIAEFFRSRRNGSYHDRTRPRPNLWRERGAKLDSWPTVARPRTCGRSRTLPDGQVIRSCTCESFPLAARKRTGRPDDQAAQCDAFMLPSDRLATCRLLRLCGYARFRLRRSRPIPPRHSSAIVAGSGVSWTLSKSTSG